MNYGKKNKMRCVSTGKYSGSTHIPINRYYNFLVYLDLLGSGINIITGHLAFNLKLREIIQGLSILLEKSIKTTLNEKNISVKKFSLGQLIKILEDKKIITPDQIKFLVDFKELRNTMIHSNLKNKVFFKDKPLLIESRIKELISMLLDIINDIENMSHHSTEAQRSHILKLANRKFPHK